MCRGDRVFQRENWGVGGEVSRVRKVKNHKEPVSEDAVGGGGVSASWQMWESGVHPPTGK